MTPSPLRVAVVSRAVYPLHGYGGLERHVFDLVTHLRARGVGVTLVTQPARNTAEPDADALRSAGIDVRTVPYRTFPLAGRRGTTVIDRSTAYLWFGRCAGRAAARLVEAGRVDLVHGMGAAVLGYAAWRRRHGAAGAPLVLNPHGLEEFGSTGRALRGLKRAAYLPLRTAVGFIARTADAVIATDRALEPVVAAHLLVAPARIRVIPNGIDLQRCDRLAGPADGAARRQALGLDPDALMFLSVGRLEENKGFQVLAEALARAARSEAGRRLGADWRWILIGDGPYRRVLEERVAASGLGSRVMLLGRVAERELHASYEAASVFVHPTLYEGSSIVTLEAMAHRRPVVATDAGGLPDKVHPGRTGWRVPAGDAGALAQALIDAADAPDRGRAFGAAGRALAEATFAWPIVAGRTVELYEELVGRGGRQAGPQAR